MSKKNKPPKLATVIQELQAFLEQLCTHEPDDGEHDPHAVFMGRGLRLSLDRAEAKAYSRLLDRFLEGGRTAIAGGGPRMASDSPHASTKRFGAAFPKAIKVGEGDLEIDFATIANSKSCGGRYVYKSF